VKKGKFVFTVTAEVALTDGKASTREYVAEDLRMHLDDDSNPGSVYPDDNEYEITSWTVMAAG
jgi:hypothetical protein